MKRNNKSLELDTDNVQQLVFGESGVFMIFDNLQSAISKGQFAVWYKNEELIGSGVID